MYLPCHTAYAWAVVAHHNEEVFGNKPDVFILPHDLDMGESLPVGTYLVLAFDDENAAVSQHSISLATAVNVEFEHGFVIFAPRPIAGAVVAIVAFVWLLAGICSAARGVHIRRVEHHAIYVPVSVWKIATVGPVCDVGWQKPISAQFDILPEHSLAIGNISYNATLRDIEFQDLGNTSSLGAWYALRTRSFLGEPFLTIRLVRVAMSVYSIQVRSHQSLNIENVAYFPREAG